jgi:hypothetical protein
MFSISPASPIADLPSPVCICCHDAGGANLIAAWVQEAPSQHFQICAEGPAHGIFSAVTGERSIQPLSAAMDGARSLLSGSGWASDLEHRARIEAKRRKLPVFAVLDHWVNYRMRFNRANVECLPDVLVVTDAEAASLAAETFGDDCRIALWDNRYLRNEVTAVHRYRERLPRGGADRRLLVVLEPIRRDWAENPTEQPEFRALDYLLRNLRAIVPDPTNLTIRLRPHPSESASKYLPWIQRNRHDLQLSSGQLAEDLAWADVTAGLNSYALVVALEAGGRAVSYLPPGAPPCPLKHRRLEHLAHLVEAAP